MIRPTKKQREEMARRLPAWFRRRKRDMPWRHTRDPYAIWISEIMLQQTRAAAVVPYYRRFLKRFPTVRALARARLDEVLKLWEGLGYYSRARCLHRAAGIVVQRFGGRLPSDAGALRMLPGVGRYTAGAIASIAFGRDEPILDGNAARVLCRVFRVTESPRNPAVRETLWRLAHRLIPAGRAGEFNQAMMELGATVCLPRSPHCPECPLETLCRARRHGEQEALPRRDAPSSLPHHTVVAGVVAKGGRILIDRRRPEGLLGGLWEFPGGKVQPGETLPDALRREIREEVGLEVKVGEEIVVVRHAYSHFRVTLHAFRCRVLRGRARALHCDEVKWVTPDQLRNFAFPTANRKILDCLRNAASATPPIEKR